MMMSCYRYLKEMSKLRATLDLDHKVTIKWPNGSSLTTMPDAFTPRQLKAIFTGAEIITKEAKWRRDLKYRWIT